MVFARCLAVDSDTFFSSSARTSVSTRADTSFHYKKPTGLAPTPSHPRSSSTTTGESADAISSSIMPTILGWARRSSSGSSSHVKERSHSADHKSGLSNQEPGSSPCKIHSHHKHRHHQKSQGNNAHSGVIFRRGDKSFLEFHQNYAITRHLGEGSYSTVKQVTHRKRGGLFACKIVDKNALSPVDRVALSQEVKVLASVRHDHVMRLYEVIEDDSKCYLIMELAEHGDLFDKIVKQGKFPEEEAQKVAAALCEALYYCHSNAIIHRDVKPENVLLSGDPNCIKLCDFGFAKQLRDVTEKSADSCGTPGYAAPEILDGKPYGLEVDVFSFGVVTYIMLCGYPPFPMKLSQLRTHRFNVRFPSKDWSQVDASVKEMITKMLHVKPEQRPKMSELRAHPWIQRGKEILDEARAEAEERKLAEALQRKQLIADTIRRKLTSTTGFEVVKHGRQGQPHRTKLRLSTDGRVLSWQPKLLKRGILKYHQNAKSITSFFGFGSHKDTNNQKQQQSVAHPQISRLSALEGARAAEGGRFSEPILCDDSERSAIVGSVHHEGLDVTPHLNGSQQLRKTDSTSSTTSTGSASWIDKKNWWRPFRRSDKSKVAGAERSSSGGVAFAAFSLAPTNQRPTTSRSFSASSSCSSAVSDSYETVDPLSGSRISCASSTSDPPSPSGYLSPGVSPRRHGGMATPPMSPSASATAERMLDSSVNLRDIRVVTLGEDSSFFQSLAGCCCCKATCGPSRGSSHDDSLAATAKTSATDSGSDHETDSNLQNATDAGDAPSELNVATAMTVATRYRELHLEFPSKDIRDAFAFLLEQATLPLEDVSHRQPSFIVRSASTPAHPEDAGSDDDGNNNNSHLHQEE